MEGRLVIDDLGFPLGDHLGMAMEFPEDGRAIAHVEVTPDLLNPHGSLHGAVPFAMLDTAMGAATLTVLEDGQRCATIEIHLRFLRPVFSGTVTADVHVLHRGSRVVHLEGSVTDETGRQVAAATGSFAVIGDT